MASREFDPISFWEHDKNHLIKVKNVHFEGKTPIEDFYNGSSQSRVVLAKPRLGGFGSANLPSSSSKGCNPFG